MFGWLWPWRYSCAYSFLQFDAWYDVYKHVDTKYEHVRCMHDILSMIYDLVCHHIHGWIKTTSPDLIPKGSKRLFSGGILPKWPYFRFVSGSWTFIQIMTSRCMHMYIIKAMFLHTLWKSHRLTRRPSWRAEISFERNILDNPSSEFQTFVPVRTSSRPVGAKFEFTWPQLTKKSRSDVFEFTSWHHLSPS